MADPQEKKIIVDEDWKSKVEAERAAAEQEAKEPQQQKAAEPRGPLPPPSLPLLASSLAFQAMISLGLMPHPGTGKAAEPDFAQAKHFIDTVEMLQQKSEGNRTPEESESLESVLHELRMMYIYAADKPKAT
jgi:hypothetical protein